MKRILHIDMDAFFAAVEILRRPELKGRPVVVGGPDPAKRGVVSTASYEARRFGVRSAMPLRTAQKLCPECVFLPVDYREYARVSRIIKGILMEFSPVMEDVGIDEAYLDISHRGEGPQELSALIKTRIKEATGLTSSIGIAPNKLLAKIASDMRKPDGLTVITPEDVATLVWPLPARKLPGIGPKTEEYLKGFGVLTIGDLAAKDAGWLEEHFGKSYGAYLYGASRGQYDSPLVTHWEPKSISREETYEADTTDWQTVAKTLASLLKDVVDQMKDEGYAAKTVTVKVRYGDFRTVSRAKTLEAHSDNLETLRRAAFDCLARVELKGRRVRLVGVRVSSLKKA